MNIMYIKIGTDEKLERNMISERVKSGMANAKAKGKRIGRPDLNVDDIVLQNGQVGEIRIKYETISWLNWCLKKMGIIDK